MKRVSFFLTRNQRGGALRTPAILVFGAKYWSRLAAAGASRYLSASYLPTLVEAPHRPWPHNYPSRCVLLRGWVPRTPPRCLRNFFH